MPQTPAGSSPRRRDRLIRERVHDPYQAREKLPDPTVCRDCGAMYRRGRWIWGSAPADAHVAQCPACHRIQDGYPEGRAEEVRQMLRRNPKPYEAEIREALSGNICRCTGYVKIIEAVQAAAEEANP